MARPRLATPPAHQIGLLQAAVAPVDQARAGWARWRAAADISSADNAESAVLPLVAARLDDLGISGADAQRLAGLRRHAAVRQLAIRRDLDGAAASLRDAGIAMVVIKGMALAASQIPGGLRDVADADVMVPHDRRRDALTCLLDAGFVLGHHLDPADLDAWADRFHAVPMRRPGGFDIDVHWRLSHQPPGTAPLTAPIFRRAVTAVGRPWQIPTLAHQAAIVVAHGVAVTSQAALRTLADLSLLLRPTLEGPASVTDAERLADEVDEILGPHRLRHAYGLIAEALRHVGLDVADVRKPVRRFEHLNTRVLTDDLDGSARWWRLRLAHRRRGIAPRPRQPALAVDARTAVVTGAAGCLAGTGFWLGDGYALWARRRAATLRLRPAAEAGSIAVGVVAPARRRPSNLPHVVVLASGRRLRIRRVGSTPTSIVVPAGPVLRVYSSRIVVPADEVGSDDHRTLAVGIVSISPGAAGGR